MLSLTSRMLGLLVFAVAVVALVADGIRSIAADRIVATSLRESWAAVDGRSLAAFDALAARHGGLAESAAAMVLASPTLAVAGLLGLGLMALGRRRRPKRHGLYY